MRRRKTEKRSVCTQYGNTKKIVSETRKEKYDIRNIILKFNVQKEASAVRRMWIIR